MDGRSVDLVLTSQGRKVADELIEQRRRLYEEMTACLLEDEKKNLLFTIERMLKDWKQRFTSEQKNSTVSPQKRIKLEVK